MFARRHRPPGNDDLGRREQRDEIGDGEAERGARVGEHARARLVAVGRALQQDAHRPLGADRAVVVAAAQQRLGFSDDRSLRSKVPQPPAAIALRSDDQVAKVGTEAVGAPEQFAVVQNAQAKAALDADHQKIVQFARLAEPVLGERDEIDVAVDRNRRAQPLRQVGPEGDVALAEDRALAAYARRAFDDAGQADANAGNIRHFEIGVADAAAHAVFDQIGDHGRGLPVDADRQRRRGGVPDDLLPALCARRRRRRAHLALQALRRLRPRRHSRRRARAAAALSARRLGLGVHRRADRHRVEVLRLLHDAVRRRLAEHRQVAARSGGDGRRGRRSSGSATSPCRCSDR